MNSKNSVVKKSKQMFFRKQTGDFAGAISWHHINSEVKRGKDLAVSGKRPRCIWKNI